MNNLPGYDKWKTASPYDDVPDSVADAERWLKYYDSLKFPDDMEYQVAGIISGLLAILEEEGVI